MGANVNYDDDVPMVLPVPVVPFVPDCNILILYLAVLLYFLTILMNSQLIWQYFRFS